MKTGSSQKRKESGRRQRSLYLVHDGFCGIQGAARVLVRSLAMRQETLLGRVAATVYAVEVNRFIHLKLDRPSVPPDGIHKINNIVSARGSPPLLQDKRVECFFDALLAVETGRTIFMVIEKD